MLNEVRVRIGADNWLEGALRCPSPNSDERPDPDDISLLVIHNISLPPGHFGGDHVRQLFTNCLDGGADATFADLVGVQVSAHLFIDRRGALMQFVAFDRRAWHAGQSIYRGRAGCNDYSIGIELEGTDHTAYENSQYDTLSDVVAMLIGRYRGLSLDAAVGHQEIAPERKSDPGPAFDWRRFYQMSYGRLEKGLR
jgi:AmpD protein